VIERHFAAHHGARPIQRKIRRQALEKQDFIRMPFELANAGPTFQRTMHISLRDLQSHNVEAYDDIVVENRQQETSLLDLSEAFNSLRITS